MKSKIVSKKAAVKSKVVSEKKEVKAEVVDKKKIKRDLLKKKFKEVCSLVEEEDGKCLVIFQSPEWDKDTITRDLGFIAVLMLKKIMHNDVYTRESKDVWKEGEGADELVYEYDKKHIKKIKEIEVEYFFGEFKIDAKTMSDVMMFNVNYLLPIGWRQPLTKGKTGERDRDHDGRIENMKKRMSDAEEKFNGRSKNKIESKKEVVKGKAVSKKKERTAVSFEVKVGNDFGLVSSERWPGESEQDHLKRVDTMIDDTIARMQNKDKTLKVSLEPVLLQ